jgi:hypothetical protein
VGCRRREERVVPTRANHILRFGSGYPIQFYCGLHTIAKSLTIRHPKHLHTRAVYDTSTLLHLASRQGHLAIARVLVEHGVDITATDMGGDSTALGVTSWWDRPRPAFCQTRRRCGNAELSCVHSDTCSVCWWSPGCCTVPCRAQR